MNNTPNIIFEQLVEPMCTVGSNVGTNVGSNVGIAAESASLSIFSVRRHDSAALLLLLLAEYNLDLMVAYAKIIQNRDGDIDGSEQTASLSKLFRSYSPIL